MRHSLAADYSDKPVTVWHPFASRVQYDTIGQYYNGKMEKLLHRPFIMAHGLGGAAALNTLNAPADGRTVFYAGMGPLILAPLMEHVPFILDDFQAVGRVTLLPIVLVARTDAPFSTFKEFEDHARRHPGTVRVAVTNKPSSLQLGMTYFVEKHTDLRVRLLEQGSPAEGAAWLLDGRADLLVTHPPDAEKGICDGDFIPLATFAGTRLPMYPDVPTVRELGYDFEQTSWRALVVRKGTPAAIVKELEGASAATFASEGARKAVANWEIIAWMGSAETEIFLRDEAARYERMAGELGLVT